MLNTLDSTAIQMQLSQGHLSVLSTCPRKFQHLYLDQLGLHQDPQLQERLDLGAQFHQLMQQQELGLSVESVSLANLSLQRWLAAFSAQPPAMISGDRQSEQRRILQFEGYLLIAVYDLLIEGAEQAQILDWKTYARPPANLQTAWQTRLYLFMLAETSDYPPEQLSITYWFAEANNRAKCSLTFAYTQTQHEQTRQELSQRLRQLTSWLTGYQAGQSLPQVPISANECSKCSFDLRCDRAASPVENRAGLVSEAQLSPETFIGSLELAIATDINQIPEIPL
ncbi:MAG: PD-(D/E)XK nuclease family protein [Aphanocapsa sp. GSE-SYN-MK-11-07L]|jgi:hypothetical protein|nr:PD-(D/E)XK nuclease family protein [Aphanocapsa sp. GSE-SYN-MK-11-07L]